MMDNQAFIGEFVEEAVTHIDTVEESLLALERGERSDELINQIFRAVHSIKGTAGFFGLNRIVELSHVMENLFSALRSHELAYRDIMTDVLLEANDCLRNMVENVLTSNECNISKCLLKLRLLAESDEPLVNEPPTRPVQRLSIFDEFNKEWPLDEAERIFVQESLKHGHHIYRITLKSGTQAMSGKINPVQFMKKMASIGNVIQSCSEGGVKAELNAQAEEGAEFVFLVTSVLEKKLLVLALGITDEQVAVLRPQTGDVWIDASQARKEEAADDFDFALRDAMSSRNELPVPGGWPESPPGPALERVSEDLSEASSRHFLPWTDAEPAEAVVVPGLFNGYPGSDESIRVSLKTLNELLGLAGEMVLARNQLMRMVERHPSTEDGMDGVVFRINHLTTDLQEKILQTRMQPASNVFNRFPRIIRDLAHKTGKDIELVIKGGDVEMDKSIIEALADPLTHIIRNAVDHGIELPAIREARGKKRSGCIELDSYHEGGQVHVLVSDDGAGIDADTIKNEAIKRSLIRSFEAEQLSEAEALNLIFRPGFSTAQALSDISGRGVGMDVVRTNIEKIGGAIDIRTEVGRGTVFDLTLPLTVAIIPALIVEAEGQRYAISRANVQEVVRLKGEESPHRMELVYETPVLRMRGTLLPLVNLGGVIEDEGDYTAGWSNIATSMSGPEFRQYFTRSDAITRILVVKAGVRRFGLVVDRIYDGEEILVNPLPCYLRNCSCYSGVSIMGDGRPAMILDPVGLAGRTNLRLYEESLSSLLEQSEQRAAAMFERQKIMLFKCSGAETFGVDLSMVARVEEIAASSLESVGDRWFTRYRDNIVRVIRPEDMLPVTRNDEPSERCFILVPKLVPRPMAILFNKIYDTVETAVHFNDETIQAPGILGSAVLMDRIVLLLNLYDIFEQVELQDGDDVGNVRSEPASPPLTGCRVLLLEDTPFFARIEKDYLEAAGARVFTAGNGQEGLNLLAVEKVDVIVSDINMPVMDGIQFIKQVRSNPATVNLPALALTSLSGDKHLQVGLRAGFDDYEIKLDKNNLLAKIKVLIQGRQASNAG